MCIKKKKEVEGEPIDTETLKGLATRAGKIAQTLKNNGSKQKILEDMLSNLTREDRTEKLTKIVAEADSER